MKLEIFSYHPSGGLYRFMNEIVKCQKCGHVLISGNGSCFFGSGITIQCKKCGNYYIFTENVLLVKDIEIERTTID